jgi:hypothetical protein
MVALHPSIYHKTSQGRHRRGWPTEVSKLWLPWRSGQSQAITREDGVGTMEVMAEMVVGEGGGSAGSRGEGGQVAGIVWGGGTADVVRIV